MILVKLGGSAITNKDTYDIRRDNKIFFRKRTGRLIQEVLSAKEEFILIHGAGPFGHPLAEKYELKNGYKNKRQLPIVAQVQHDVRTLNQKVLHVVKEKGLTAASMPPSALVTFKNGELEDINMKPFKHYLKIGAVPVTFGDVVPDISRKFGICSGDDLMLRLAREFKPKLAVFVTKVDGIYTKDPKDRRPPKAEFIPEINEKTIKLIQDPRDRVADVTGRMRRKAEKMLEIAEEGVDCIVLNGLVRTRLRKAIKGEKVKYTIARGKR